MAPGFAIPEYKRPFAVRSAGRSGNFGSERATQRGEQGAENRSGAYGGGPRGYGGRRGGDGERRGSDRHEQKKVKTFGKDSFSLDKETVDLRYVEQLADSEQTCGLAYLLRYAVEHVIDGRRSVREVVDVLSNTLDQKGWEPFCGSYVPCGLAKPRRQEIFACLNRYRG